MLFALSCQCNAERCTLYDWLSVVFDSDLRHLYSGLQPSSRVGHCGDPSLWNTGLCQQMIPYEYRRPWGLQYAPDQSELQVGSFSHDLTWMLDRGERPLPP
jgi:hypothetical protein